MNATLDRPPLQGVDYITKLTGMPTHRAYDYIRQGRIPAVRIGRRIMVDPLAIERWIAAGGTSSEAA